MSRPNDLRSDPEILLESVRKYWHYFALTIGLSLSAAVFEGLSIGMLIPFLQAFGNEEAFKIGIGWVDRYILGSEDSEIVRMYRICGVILIATWIRLVLGYSSGVIGTVARVRTVEDIRMRIVDRLQSVSMRFYSTTRGGEILNSMTNEIGRAVAAIGLIVGAVQQGSMLAIYVGLMVWISWEMTVFVLIVFSVLSYLLKWIIASVRERGEDITSWSGNFTSAISEFIDGARTVMAHNRQEYERERLHTAANEFASSVIASAKRKKLLQPLSQAVMTTVLIGLIIFAMLTLVMPGNLDLAFLLTFLFALFRATPTVHQLNGMRGDWAENRAGLRNIAALLRDDKPAIENGSRQAPPLRRSIVFENVWFAYEPETPVLKDINLSIEVGKTTALVGASGAGKSTLADLIPRFYDPTGGRILYDGIDLREFDFYTLRDRIAIVSQATHVFNATVKANIAYGNPNASFDKIQEAAYRANALQFIEELENGFEEELGDRGVRLSGGQRQRLSIARALLKNPEILVMDEATSDLDSISERMVQQSLEDLMQGRTVIAIAHRLSTIQNADHVVVLEEGQVVEQGRYDDLVSQQGKLWEYHKIQYEAA